jgi:hypothetical protein
MDKREEDEYTDRYVAFLDLLGFKALVQRSEIDSSEKTRLVQVLKVMRDTLYSYSEHGLCFAHFSDCMIFSADRNAYGLWETFQSITALTFILLQFDVLLRDALVAGPAHAQQGF